MDQRTFTYRRAERGFTLLEILIAIFILGIVLTTIFAAYSGTLTIIRELDDDARAFRMAQTTLDRMRRDLTSLQRFGNAFSLKSEERHFGNHSFDAIGFWSAAHLSFEEGAQTGAPAMITYFAHADEDGGFSLWRSDVAAAKPASIPNTDSGIIICEDLQALKLKYFDENGREQDTWDTDAAIDAQKGKPPRQIQIALALVNRKDAEKPYQFITRVFLPVRK